jgi:hypothetical protein
MNTVPGCWRRLAATLARHAAWVLPGAPWADAMRRELDYIENDRAALGWALGCILASYRARLIRRPIFSTWVAWRSVSTSGVLMLVIALALLENAGGQTAPPRPPLDETTCDLPGPRGAATAAAPCCATERNDRALDRVFPDRAQREPIQSVRGSIAADSNDHSAQAPETSCADRSHQEHDPEQARAGRDPGWPPVFGKDMLQQ